MYTWNEVTNLRHGMRLAENSVQTNISFRDVELEGHRASLTVFVQHLRYNTGCKRLRLTNCNVTDQDCVALSQMLRVNNFLEHLDLSFNSISDEGAQHIAEALKRNFALKELVLEHNQIGEEGAAYLAQALILNDTLEVFHIEWNHFGGGCVGAFAECFRRNRSLQNIRMYVPKEFQADLLKALQSNSFLVEGEIGGQQANQELQQITNRNYLRRSAPKTLQMLEYSQSKNTRWTHPVVVVLGPPAAGRTRLAQALLGEPYDPRFSHTSGLTMANVSIRDALGDGTMWGKAANMSLSPLNDYLNDKADGVPEDAMLLTSSQPSRVRKGLAVFAHGVKSIIKLIRQDVDPTPPERLKFQLWDFSSAALKANAHRVFLNVANLAVITVNARNFVTSLLSKRLQSARQLRQWLNDLVCFAPTVTVMIVATHAQGLNVDGATTLDTTIRKVLEEFSATLTILPDRAQSRPWFAVNSLTHRGVDAVKEVVQGFVKAAMPEQLPLPWLVLLQHLVTTQRDARRSIPIAEVSTLAKSYNVSTKEEIETMLHQFCESGYVWRTQDDMILDNHWLYTEITKLTANRRTTIATLESNALLSELSRGFVTKDVLLALWQRWELPESVMRKFYLLTPWHEIHAETNTQADRKYIVHANLTKAPYGTRKQDPTIRATLSMSVQDTLSLPQGVTERFIAVCAQAINSCGPGDLLKSSFARNYCFLTFADAQQVRMRSNGHNVDISLRNFSQTAKVVGLLKTCLRILNTDLPYPTSRYAMSISFVDGRNIIPYDQAAQANLAPWFLEAGPVQLYDNFVV